MILKKNSVVITYLPLIENYTDRFTQLVNSAKLRDTIKIILYTKSLKKTQSFNHNIPKNLEIVFLNDTILRKSVFLQIFIYLKILHIKNPVLIDWFSSFYLIGLINKISFGKVIYIFSPVISNWGWVVKQISGKVPIFDFRYFLIRLKLVIPELISIFTSSRVIVQSDALKHFYKKNYKIKNEKLLVNYNYFEINSKEKVLFKSKNKPILGFIGNFERHKGNVELFNLAKSNTFELKIAGRTSGKKNITLLNKILNLNNVELFGDLNWVDIDLFYNNIDILILPSFHEGSPRVICEFIKYKKPIITYRNPGLDYCDKLSHVYQLDYHESFLSFSNIINKISSKNMYIDLENFEIDNKIHLLFK